MEMFMAADCKGWSLLWTLTQIWLKLAVSWEFGLACLAFLPDWLLYMIDKFLSFLRLDDDQNGLLKNYDLSTILGSEFSSGWSVSIYFDASYNIDNYFRLHLLWNSY